MSEEILPPSFFFLTSLSFQALSIFTSNSSLLFFCVHTSLSHSFNSTVYVFTVISFITYSYCPEFSSLLYSGMSYLLFFLFFFCLTFLVLHTRSVLFCLPLLSFFLLSLLSLLQCYPLFFISILRSLSLLFDLNYLVLSITPFLSSYSLHPLYLPLHPNHDISYQTNVHYRAYK